MEHVRGSGWSVALSLAARRATRSHRAGNGSGDRCRETDDLLDVSSFYVIQEPGQKLVRVEGTATTVTDTVWNFGFGEVKVDSTAEVSGKPISGARAIVWEQSGRDRDDRGGLRRVSLDERPVITPPEEPTEDEG